MQNAITLYYSPEAALSGAGIFYDGSAFFEPVYSVFQGLNGRRKKRFKGFLKKVGKGLKKVAKTSYKVIKKALPVADAVLTFIPGVGWAAKGAIAAARLGINLAERRKARKADNQAMEQSEVAQPGIEQASEASPEARESDAFRAQAPKQPTHKPVSYTDIVTTQQAYAKRQATPDNIIDITKLITPTTDLLSQLTTAKTSGGVSRKEMRTLTRTKTRAKYSIV